MKDYGPINHIFREQNKVADALAKLRENNGDQEFYRAKDLPPAINKLLFLDRIGLQSFRSYNL